MDNELTELQIEYYKRRNAVEAECQAGLIQPYERDSLLRVMTAYYKVLDNDIKIGGSE